MEIAQHADACVKTFGKPYYEVHHILDQFAMQFPGFAHRRLLHHRLGIDLVVKRFGAEAQQPAELHIQQDTSGVIPEDWADYGEPLLLKLEDYDHQDEILRELYGDTVFHEVQAKLI